jgi:hypothetical protein
MLLIMLSASGSPSHYIQHAHEEHPPTPVPLHRDITLTPRQRIAVYKELYRLRQMENRTPQQQQRLDEMAAIFEYDGQDTCAAGAPPDPSASILLACPDPPPAAQAPECPAQLPPALWPLVCSSRLLFESPSFVGCRWHVPGEVPRED